MKLVVSVLAIILVTGCMNSKKKIIFFGDSITQFGVAPGGYIDLIQQKYAAANTAVKYDFIGAGISGNKVYDLYLRTEEDVLSQMPDVVIIWIGVNDVWHKSSLGTGTDADKFEKFYSAIIKKLQEKNIKVIVATPAAIGEKYDNSNPQDNDLNLYAEIIRKLAKQFNCGLCDLRYAFTEYEKVNNTTNAIAGILTTDGVHLNAKGNEMVADEMMKVIMQ